jgi:hypothetical protein
VPRAKLAKTLFRKKKNIRDQGIVIHICG